MGSMGMGGTGGQGPAGAAGMSKGARGALSAGPGRGGGNMGRTAGPQGAYNPRYTPTKTPVYDASIENLAKLATRIAPGPGLISGAIMDIGGFRPGFSGFQGMGNGYSYDNKGEFGSAMGAGSPGLMTGLRGLDYDMMPQRQAAPRPVAPQQSAAPVGLQFKPLYQGGRYIGADVPGMGSYGLMTKPYRVFG